MDHPQVKKVAVADLPTPALVGPPLSPSKRQQMLDRIKGVEQCRVVLFGNKILKGNHYVQIAIEEKMAHLWVYDIGQFVVDAHFIQYEAVNRPTIGQLGKLYYRAEIIGRTTSNEAFVPIVSGLTYHGCQIILEFLRNGIYKGEKA